MKVVHRSGPSAGERQKASIGVAHWLYAHSRAFVSMSHAALGMSSFRGHEAGSRPEGHFLGVLAGAEILRKFLSSEGVAQITTNNLQLNVRHRMI